MSLTQVATVSELPKVHPTSQAGFGRGKAELYDATRPAFQPEVLSHIRKALSEKHELNIVEIASGSGKLTRALLAHVEWKQSITELRCIDPNDGMRAVFQRTVNDSRVSLSEGTFDDTNVPDGWADLIIIATAFHWCLDLEAALNEFTRVLKPDGVVCLLWNLEDYTESTWVQQLYEICLPLRENTPSSASGMTRWRQLYDLPLYKANFTPPEETIIRFVEPRTVDSIIALYLTWSGVALLPAERKEELKEQIRGVIRRGDGLVWLDDKQEILEAPFLSPVVIFHRVSK